MTKTPKAAKSKDAPSKEPKLPFDLDNPKFPKELDEKSFASGGFPYEKKLKREA